MTSRSKTNFKVPNFPKTDQRLIGTWKSDKRRTFAEWNWKKNLSPTKKKRFKAIFGKAEIIYTHSKVISRLPHRNWESSRHYCILAADEASVAILEFGELEIKNQRKYWNEGVEMVKEFMSKPEIKHIHFCEDYFWISIGNGRHREFFRKICDSKRLNQS